MLGVCCMLTANSYKQILLQQIRSQGFSALVGLLLLPFGDFGEVARGEDFGDFPAVEVCWASVYRWGEKVVLEAVGKCRCLVTNCAWEQADNRVGDDCRSKFSARKNIVTDRDLAGNKVLANTIVDALIVTAEDDDILKG